MHCIHLLSRIAGLYMSACVCLVKSLKVIISVLLHMDFLKAAYSDFDDEEEKG